jgi:hypothetical protein
MPFSGITMPRRIDCTVLGIFMVSTCASPLGGGSTADGDDHAPPAKVVFADLRTEVSRVNLYRDKFIILEKSIVQVFARMPKQVDALEQANDRVSMPKEYLSALNNEVILFRKISTVDPGANDVKLLRDICDDLESKVLAADPNIKEGKPYSVKVVANTRDIRQQAVNGLVVGYVQKGYLKDAKRHGKFPKLSTPTEREFVPGNWVLWTAKEKAKGTEKDVPVRPQNGKRELEVDIASP